jgi:hypothetical protein
MKPDQPRDSWSRLVAAARTVRDDRPTTAPFGFSTRVAALAAGAGRVKVSLVERFALRAVSFACLLAFGSIVVNLSLVTAVTTDAGADQAEEVEDPVAILLAE